MRGTAKERLVVKIGTSTLTHENGKANLRQMEGLCRLLADLENGGYEILLVTSGAIGVGVGKLGLPERPKETERKQAVAAIGQCELMFLYDKFFGEYNQTVAQVLLSKNNTDNETGRMNVVNTLSALFQMRVIPVVNENDTVDTAELEGTNFGDNDMLSAIVAELVDADRLVILTDTEGLYDRDPRNDPAAKLIHLVPEITEEIVRLAGGRGSKRGTGGMATKVAAAKYATASGIPCHIINGSKLQLIYDVLEGKEAGTYFQGAKK